MDIWKLQEVIRCNIGDYTFEEAYQKTGRILNITVTSARPILRPLLSLLSTKVGEEAQRSNELSPRSY